MFYRCYRPLANFQVLKINFNIRFQRYANKVGVPKKNFNIHEASKNDVSLRDYQQKCVETVVKKVSQNKQQKLAVSIATGGGKTVIFSSLIPKLLQLRNLQDSADQRRGILIIVHRTELAKQTIATLKQLHSISEDRIFLDMAKSKIDKSIFHDGKPFVIVASISTLARSSERLENYYEYGFMAVIIDECHHATSPSYLKLMNHLFCLKRSVLSKKMELKETDNPYVPHLLGFSATLGRSDGQPLNHVFDEIVYEKSISSLIDEQHLCDFDWYNVELGLNLDQVETQGNNFVLTSLSKYLNTEEVTRACLQTYKKFRIDHPQNFKSTLVFGVGVDHIRDLSEAFRANKINAQYVTGETKASERASIIQDFKDGKIEVLLNCGVFTEGTDIPNIDSILLLRPTKSVSLLTQMVGRGLRNHNNKNKLIVVDFVDNKTVGLAVTSKLTGKKNIVSLLEMKFEGNRGRSNHDDLFPGEVDYLSLKRLEGYKSLLPESGKSNVLTLLKYMKRINSSQKYEWIQTSYNTWILSSERSYFQVETTNTGFILSRKYTYYTSTGNPRVRKLEVAQTNDVERIIPLLEEYLAENTSVEDGLRKQQSSYGRMKTQKPTETQKKFVLGVVNKFIDSNMAHALDSDKFKEKFRRKLGSMSKYDISKLIAAFVASRNQALFIYVRETFLRSQADRDEITKEDILQKRKKLKEEGWI